jgi:two-component system, NarL family, nitrate/nitrite response regulator NarL
MRFRSSFNSFTNSRSLKTERLFTSSRNCFLQNTPYKVLATAAGPADLPRIHNAHGQQILAIVGINDESGNLDEAAESVRKLRSSMRDGKVALIVQTNGAIDVHRVLTLSPDACIFNLGSRDILIKILELVIMDQRVLVLSDSTASPARAPAPNTNDSHDVSGPPNAPLSSLSRRERQILVALADGKSNKAIARLYSLSEATVKIHLKAILRKTKTHNRTQAAIWAIQHHFQEHSRGMVSDAPSLAPVGQLGTMRKIASDQNFGSELSGATK